MFNRASRATGEREWGKEKGERRGREGENKFLRHAYIDMLVHVLFHL